MPFEITADTPIRHLPDGIDIVSGPGGSPWVVDPKQPHLGGNFDGGDLGSLYPNDLWPWLVSQSAVQTMADIGAGTGESARWFGAQGIKTLCVEGLEWNARKCPHFAIIHDFQNGPCWFVPVDLIWCADVAEHIDERFVGNLLRTLSQCKVLAMCQGTQDHPTGWHHVNNQTEQYWVDKLAGIGMIMDAEATKHSREIANHGWWAVSGHIYRKRE